MTSSYLRQPLPSTRDLPCSDDTPVDNEEQNLLPNLLLLLLTSLWAERMDWFFGVDMAVYHTTGISPNVPVVPDAFLSLGVARKKGDEFRRSYAVWEEQDVVPTFVLEMVSHKPGGEYDEKLDIYAKLGVLYYVIYNPGYWQRDRHQPFEVYKLEAGAYRLQIGEPYWMPEVGLGIGRYQGEVGGLSREILTWYDEQGNRHFSEAEQARLQAEQSRLQAEQAQLQAEQAGQRAEQAGQRAEQAETLVQQERLRRERLEERLRAQGVDPDDFA
ncbi:MAG: Uma2 family endonuclease [Phormidesmis sp.]